jgi:integrase
VDDLKTIYSGRKMSIDASMLAVLKAWRQTTQFSADEDWVFTSPVRHGRQPWFYDQVWRSFLNAGAVAGIGKLGTHSMRHNYRSWLDAKLRLQYSKN